MCHIAESRHKSLVVQGRSKEATYILNILRFRAFDYLFNLLRRSLNSFGADFKTNVIDLVHQKCAFVKSSVQFCFPELSQGPPKLLPMLVQVSTENYYIVQVFYNKSSNIVLKILFISRWKLAGTLYSPNGITRNLKRPRFVRKLFSISKILPLQSHGIHMRGPDS